MGKQIKVKQLVTTEEDVQNIKLTRGYRTQIGEIRINGTVKNHNDLICGTGIEYLLKKELSNYFQCKNFDEMVNWKEKLPDDLLLFDRNYTINGKTINEDIINLAGNVVDIKTQSYVTTIIDYSTNEITGINTKRQELPEIYKQFFIVDMSVEQIKKSRAEFYVFYYHKQKKINNENVYDYDYIGYLTKEQVLKSHTEARIVDNMLNNTWQDKRGCWINSEDIGRNLNWLKD